MEYNNSLQFYLKHGTDEVLKQILSIGDTQYNRELLHEALAELDIPEEQPAVNKSAPSSDRVTTLEQKWKRQFKAMAHVKSTLPFLEDPEDRRKACLEIVSTFKDSIIPAWQAIDHYKATGELPPEEPEQRYLEQLAPLTEAQAWAVQQLKNIPTRITKAKRKGQYDKVEELEQELALIKTKLYGTV